MTTYIYIGAGVAVAAVLGYMGYKVVKNRSAAKIDTAKAAVKDAVKDAVKESGVAADAVSGKVVIAVDSVKDAVKDAVKEAAKDISKDFHKTMGGVVEALESLSGQPKTRKKWSRKAKVGTPATA